MSGQAPVDVAGLVELDPSSIGVAVLLIVVLVAGFDLGIAFLVMGVRGAAGQDPDNGPNP